MLDHIKLQNILFMDIETVPQHSVYDEIAGEMRPLWEKKAKQIIKDEKETSDSIYRQAGIYAEFGKIVCISCGYFFDNRKFRIKSFFGEDEKKLLTDFAEALNRFFHRRNRFLCAHNGKEFDFPFLARRMV